MKTLIQFFILIFTITILSGCSKEMESTREVNQKTKDTHFLGKLSKEDVGVWDSGVLSFINNFNPNPPVTIKGTIWKITYLKANGFNMPMFGSTTIEIITDNSYGLNAEYTDNNNNKTLVRMWVENIMGNMGQVQLHLDYIPILTGSQLYTGKISAGFLGSGPHPNAIFQATIKPYGQTGTNYKISMDRIK